MKSRLRERIKLTLLEEFDLGMIPVKDTEIDKDAAVDTKLLLLVLLKK